MPPSRRKAAQLGEFLIGAGNGGRGKGGRARGGRGVGAGAGVPVEAVGPVEESVGEPEAPRVEHIPRAEQHPIPETNGISPTCSEVSCGGSSVGTFSNPSSARGALSEAGEKPQGSDPGTPPFGFQQLLLSPSTPPLSATAPLSLEDLPMGQLDFLHTVPLSFTGFGPEPAPVGQRLLHIDFPE